MEVSFIDEKYSSSKTPYVYIKLEVDKKADRKMLHYINLKLKHDTANLLTYEDFKTAKKYIGFQEEIKDGLTAAND